MLNLTFFDSLNGPHSVDLMRLILVFDAEECDLRLTKKALPDRVSTGDTISYTLKLKNEGPDTATAITLQDMLADSTILDTESISPPPLQINDRKITWDIDKLAPDSSLVFSYRVKVIQIQSSPLLVNRSEVSSACGGDSAMAVVEVVPDSTDLELTKSVPPAMVCRGDAFLYSLTIRNIGEKTATGVIVEDILPDSVEFVSFFSQPAGVQVPGNDRRYRWVLGDLAPSAELLIEFEAVYPANLDLPEDPLERVNIACVGAANDSNPANNCDSASVFVTICDIDDCIVLDRNVFEPERTDPLKISFKLGTPGLVKIKVLDITGYLVTNLVDEDYPANEHTVEWDGTIQNGQKVGSGVYLIYFWSSGFDCLEKVIVAR